MTSCYTKRMNEAAFEDLKQFIDTRIGGLEIQIDGVHTRIDGIDVRLGRLDAKVAGLDTKISRLDTKVAGLDGKIDDLEVKINRLDTKVDDLRTEMHDGFAGIADAVEQINERDALVEKRLTKLEQKAA